jgi:hypothetical protein
MKKNDSYKENRETLKAISRPAQQLVKAGAYNSVNEVLIDMYKEKHPEIQRFETFHNWKRLGKTILKGSKAFLIWGQPKNMKPKEATATDADEFQFFPMCYLFADTQVK